MQIQSLFLNYPTNMKQYDNSELPKTSKQQD